MKYEITKGSEKDFEGAPEWCTHVSKSTSSGDLAWEMSSVTKDGNKYSWVDELSGYGVYENASGMKLNIIAERRPITEPVWSGEGLPPVGIECEIKRVADWFPVTIKFISGYYTVILTRAGTEDAYQTSALQFRPIRSPEDVAKDEAIESMAEIIEYRTGCSPKPLARWLYEAGYRKME